MKRWHNRIKRFVLFFGTSDFQGEKKLKTSIMFIDGYILYECRYIYCILYRVNTIDGKANNGPSNTYYDKRQSTVTTKINRNTQKHVHTYLQYSKALNNIYVYDIYFKTIYLFLNRRNVIILKTNNNNYLFISTWFSIMIF